MNESNAYRSLPGPWGSRVVEDGKTTAVRIGPRDLWLRSREGEVWVAHARNHHDGDPTAAEEGSPEAEPPSDHDWTRWAPPAQERVVGLLPVMPDRPLVLQPERPFTLLPGADARIYVRVPLWIRVELRGAEEHGSDAAMLLFELPSAELSDTWWGGFLEGELCYWLPTTARREMRAELFAPHLAVCPLLMVNRSEEDLHVEKLAFRVAHLTLFATDSGIWADPSRVVYRGDEEGSQIVMTGTAPDEARGATRIAGPRMPAARGLRARTFSKLREMPGMGGIW